VVASARGGLFITCGNVDASAVSISACRSVSLVACLKWGHTVGGAAVSLGLYTTPSFRPLVYHGRGLRRIGRPFSPLARPPCLPSLTCAKNRFPAPLVCADVGSLTGYLVGFGDLRVVLDSRDWYIYRMVDAADVVHNKKKHEAIHGAVLAGSRGRRSRRMRGMRYFSVCACGVIAGRAVCLWVGHRRRMVSKFGIRELAAVFPFPMRYGMAVTCLARIAIRQYVSSTIRSAGHLVGA